MNALMQEREAREAALVAAAREWIEDCFENLGFITDAQVVNGIERHYEGGWAGFVADGAE